MKKIASFSLLLIIVLALAACSSPKPATSTAAPSQQPGLPTLSAPSTPEPAGEEANPPTAPADEGSPYVQYYNPEADFSLAIPPDWSAGEPKAGPLGNQTNLGPDPESETSSAVIVADASKIKPDQVVKELCKDCNPQPQVQPAKIAGMDASVFEVVTADIPPVQWYLLPKDNHLLILSLHDPDTLQTLDALLQSFSAGKNAGSGLKYGPAAWVAQQTFSAEMGVLPYQIIVTDIQPKDWPDSCLGAADEGEECTQESTPGYIGTVQYGNVTAEFHSNQDGSQLRTIPGAVLAVRKQVMADKKLGESDVKAVQVEQVDWADTCLEAPKADETCDQVVTSGYRVVIDAKGEKLEFHTDLAGSIIRPAPKQ